VLFEKRGYGMRSQKDEDYSPFGVLSFSEDNDDQNSSNLKLDSDIPNFEKDFLKKNGLSTQINNSHEFVANIAKAFLPKRKIRQKFDGEDYEFRKDFNSPSIMHASYYLNGDKL
jgi:hypothetical protein